MLPRLLLLVLSATLALLSLAIPTDANDLGTTVSLASITDGRGQLDLREYRGKVVYLDFWASWCRPCRRSFEWMSQMHERYSKDGLVVIAVNVDRERAQAHRFLQKMRPPFRIVFDPEAVLARAHDLAAMPSSFVYGRDGSLRHAHEGFRGGDREALEGTVSAVLGSNTEGKAP
jgi:thiol-disulfide isomerase/thioredoxin